MTRPTPFDRQISFAFYSAENPDVPHSGADLDTEFNAVKVAVDETQANLALIQDEDGALKRASVGRDQLDSSITIGFASPTPWAPNTAYTDAISTVFYEAIFYTCTEDHTSGATFDADKWLEVADLSVAAALADGAVTEAKLAEGAVTPDKIAAGSVATSKLASNAVSTSKVQDSAITTAKIADTSITTAKIGDAAVTTAKIADASITGAKLDANVVTTAKIADANVTQAKIAAAAQAVFTAQAPGFLFGRTISNNASDAVNDIDISAGVSRDSTDTVNIVGTAITKRLDATFVAGTNQGGRSSSSLADGTWHVFDIAKADGTPDVLFHDAVDPTSVMNTGALVGYVYFRHVASIIRSGGGILAFKQFGDDFFLADAVTDVNAAAASATPALVTLTVPAGLKVKAYLNAAVINAGVGSNPNNAFLWISSPDVNSQTAGTGRPSVGISVTPSSGTITSAGAGGECDTYTDTSRRVRVVSSAPLGTQTYSIITRGWNFTRGRLA